MLLSTHVRPRGMRQQPRSPDVHLQRPGEIVFRRLCKVFQDEKSSVVNDDVDTAKFGDRTSNGFRGSGRVGDVALRRDRMSACGINLLSDNLGVLDVMNNDVGSPPS